MVHESVRGLTSTYQHSMWIDVCRVYLERLTSFTTALANLCHKFKPIHVMHNGFPAVSKRGLQVK